jgi:hypothetical protein
MPNGKTEGPVPLDEDLLIDDFQTLEFEEDYRPPGQREKTKAKFDGVLRDTKEATLEELGPVLYGSHRTQWVRILHNSLIVRKLLVNEDGSPKGYARIPGRTLVPFYSPYSVEGMTLFLEGIWPRGNCKPIDLGKIRDIPTEKPIHHENIFQGSVIFDRTTQEPVYLDEKAVARYSAEISALLKIEIARHKMTDTAFSEWRDRDKEVREYREEVRKRIEGGD